MSWTILFLGQESPLFFNIWEPVAFGTAEEPRLWLLRISFHKEIDTNRPRFDIVQLIYSKGCYTIRPAGSSPQVVPLYASLPPAQQQKIFDEAPAAKTAGGPPGRKIVISTNIAETSLTIDGVLYVVDAGLSKTRAFHAGKGIDSLLALPISQAAAPQPRPRPEPHP